MTQSSNDYILAGIDIGGSKTHALRTDRTGAVARAATAGSANFESVSRTQALQALDTIFDQIGRDDIDVICVGSAGINTPAQEGDLAAVIAERAPGARVIVAHDTRLILAAAELDDGIAVISGTGSVAWGQTPDGRTARSGGWGYLLGDDGGGYGLVRDAVRHVLRRSDCGLPTDPLTETLCAAADATGPYDLLARFYAQPSRRYWAQRSTVIFDLAAAGDGTSAALIEQTAQALVELIIAVAEQLGQPGPVALGGGLVVNQPVIQELVTATLHTHGISDVRPLLHEPAHGALYLAARAAPDR